MIFYVILSTCIFFIEIYAFPKQDYGNISETEKQMMYLLYTRSNPMTPQFFVLNDMDYLQFTHFDINKPVKILIHGWKCSYKSPVNVLIKNAYLIQMDVNVVIVDWEPLALGCYWTAKGHVPNVGKIVAVMIDQFISKLGIKSQNIHVVGHSLGAHVAGVAGQLVQNGPLPRITGLDPAGPFYFSNDMKIGKNSANFVDIIHTAGYMTGYHGELGHVDFYPNGGYPIQPGCGIDFTSLRSHRRAYWLFAESIVTRNGFLAVSCSGWSEFKSGKCPQNGTVTEMGEHASKNARGSYFLTTSSQTPFALGEKSLYYDL